ncbi:MAG: nucleotidyltransferase [Kofleriaceae bacterium]
MTARADRQLEQALRDLAAALTSTGAQWMIIGGIAVIARGVRRFTSDIDATIRGDEIDASTLLEVLAKKRIVPRIANAEQFARESLVLLLHHEPSGVDFDVSFAWTEFEHEAITSATTAKFGAVKAPMARPEDLIVFKAIAGRGKDNDDVTALLTLYPEIDLMRVRAWVRELTAMADAPEMFNGLEKAIAASVKLTKQRRTSAVKKPTPRATKPRKKAGSPKPVKKKR